MSDYFLHKKLWNGSPSQSSDTTFIHTKINCTIIFFHPDCTVGPGISPCPEDIFLFILILYLLFVKQNFYFTHFTFFSGVWQLNNQNSPCRPYKTCIFMSNILDSIYISVPPGHTRNYWRRNSGTKKSPSSFLMVLICFFVSHPFDKLQFI